MIRSSALALAVLFTFGAGAAHAGGNKRTVHTEINTMWKVGDAHVKVTEIHVENSHEKDGLTSITVEVKKPKKNGEEKSVRRSLERRKNGDYYVTLDHTSTGPGSSSFTQHHNLPGNPDKEVFANEMIDKLNKLK